MSRRCGPWCQTQPSRSGASFCATIPSVKPLRRLFRAYLLCLLGVLAACSRARQAPVPPLVAPLKGTLALPGLAAPVRVVRDAWGVPHIYAQNDGDLFFAQGFVQAQDSSSVTR
jgi:acyl-homoserine lactone acylase PvdQ